MPFSPASKACLLAVVLVILNHVPRLSAAPLVPREPWKEGIRQAGNLVDDRTGTFTPMNLAPGTDRERPYGLSGYAVHNPGINYDPIGRESTRLFSQQTWVPAVTPNIGVGGAELRSGEGWVLGDRPLTRAVGDPNVGAEGAELRSGEGWVPRDRPLTPDAGTPRVGVEDAEPRYGEGRGPRGRPSNQAVGTLNIGIEGAELRSGEGRALHGNASIQPPANLYDIRPRSEQDPVAFFASLEWLQLDRKAKDDALKELGHMVFTARGFGALHSLEGQEHVKDQQMSVRKASDLQRELVKEYLKLRLEGTDSPQIQIGWDSDAMPANGHLLDKVHDIVKNQGDPSESALDHGKKDAFKPLRLGDFAVYFSGETRKNKRFLLGSRATEMEPFELNVLAVGPHKERIYFGKVKFTPVGESKQVKTQRGTKSRSRRSKA